MPRKGITNNPNGRPKGAPNRTTLEIKDLILTFITGAIPDLEAEYQKLDPEKKLIFLERMLKYVIPTKTALSGDPENPLNSTTIVWGDGKHIKI